MPHKHNGKRHHITIRVRIRRWYVNGLRVVMVAMHSAMFVIGHAHIPEMLAASVTLVWMLEEVSGLMGWEA